MPHQLRTGKKILDVREVLRVEVLKRVMCVLRCSGGYFDESAEEVWVREV